MINQIAIPDANKMGRHNFLFYKVHGKYSMKCLWINGRREKPSAMRTTDKGLTFLMYKECLHVDKKIIRQNKITEESITKVYKGKGC